MITALATRVTRSLRKLRLNLIGVSNLAHPRALGRHVDAALGWGSNGKGQITVGENAWLETGVVLHAFGGQIRIGKDAFLGPFSVVYGHGGVEIGDACLIAMHCRILSSNHTLAPFGTDIRSQPDDLRPTRIGRDVWLGAGVTVLGGVTIEDGCVVGAGAVVTKDLPPGAIAMGVPATVRGFRSRQTERPNP